MHDLVIIAIAAIACVALGYQQWTYIKRRRRIIRRRLYGLNEIRGRK